MLCLLAINQPSLFQVIYHLVSDWHGKKSSQINIPRLDSRHWRVKNERADRIYRNASLHVAEK